MAIAVRSVKAGMTRFGYLRSRLKNGAKLGCRGQRLAPRLGRLHGVHVDFSVIGVRNFTPPSHKRQAYKTFIDLA